MSAVQFRSATPAATTPAATETTPTPPANPNPVQTRNTPPANPNPTTPRPVADVTAERQRLLGEADQIQQRSRVQALTAEDEQHLDQLLDRIEVLNEELPRSRRNERLAAQRALNDQPTRPAPVFTSTQRSNDAGGDDSEAEAFRIWLRSFTDEPDNRPDANYRASRHGFNIGSPSARIRCDYGTTLNQAKRRTLSKGGAGTGAEVIPNTYSQKVTEYITFFSPIVGLVDSEVTTDGNKRTYFKIDDTGLISTYITASSGTEINPTIPDKDVATGSIDINVFDITSGYHKLTRPVLRDSAVTLQDKVTKAIGNSHARLIEKDMINGTGNGTTSIQGLIASATVYGGAGVDAFTPDLFEALYFAVPAQYRSLAVWLFSDTAMAKAVNKLKDTTGRSLFGKTAENGLEIRTLFERPAMTSSYMPAYGANAKSVWFGVPGFYMLRVVEGQSIDVLREKFYPHLAFAGGMSFGGAFLGPANTSYVIQSDAAPDGGS